MTTCATKSSAFLLFVSLAGGVLPAFAEEGQSEVFVRAAPARYIVVDGDDEKFRAQHGMSDGFAGGLREVSVQSVLSQGATLKADGHALGGQNEFNGTLSLDKQGLGFLNLDYSKFQKYYDGTGGMYHFFTSVQSNETNRDLALAMGHIGFSTGLNVDGWPALSAEYSREFKNGVKSRLTWTAVKEGTTTRNIGPSWQEVDEATDNFAVKASHEIAGFSVSGEQRWEFLRSELLREERSLSTTSAAADKKVRRQEQNPESNLMTTTLTSQRNFFNDKLFFSSAYRFAHMNNREFESIVESNAGGTPTNFSNPKQIRAARADNDYDTHTWTGSLMASPWKQLSLGTRLKAELIHRESNSSYPADASPNSAGGSSPDGVIDQQVVSLNQSRAVRWGEALLARFTGLPKTALYAELELEQGRVRLFEDRKDLLGVNAGETFNRFTIDNVERETATVGGQAFPWSFLNLTAQLRRRRNNNDYDDQRETDSTGTTARSAFVDGQRVDTNEVSTRVTWKPARWVQPSFRYQLRDDDFATRAENQPIVKTGMLSHIYTFDLVLQTSEKLMATLSFSRQTAATTTPARSASAGTTPTFNANVNTWLASVDYAFNERWTASASTQYSRADNFNDFGRTLGLPLGVENEQLDLTTGLRWAVGEDASLEARYAFYHYLANSNAEVGDYDAHAIWLEGSKKF